MVELERRIQEELNSIDLKFSDEYDRIKGLTRIHTLKWVLKLIEEEKVKELKE